MGRSIGLLLLVLFTHPLFLGPATADDIIRVKQVYDGDTVLLEDGRKVRYLGINAPEYREPFYLKAKRVNESLVRGKEIRLEFDRERTDGYDRILAYIYVGDQMVNARLVGEGLAHAFFIGPNRKHNTLLLQAQVSAKQRKVGIWSARTRPKTLKVTSVHVADPDRPDPYAPYVRITNLQDGPVRLVGYVLSNESGHRYHFPDVAIDPGHTVIVASTEGNDGIDAKGQMVVHWPAQGSVWDTREDTAFLTDPSGETVDLFHYKGKRLKSSLPPSRRKAP